MIRPTVPADTPTLLALTEGTGLFWPIDLDALDSVLKDYHAGTAGPDHYCVTWEENGQPIGFAYYGATPMTDRTWHLWWIVVSKQIQARGVGGQLLQYAEDEARVRNARLFLIETSDIPSYELTRKFYFKHGYELAATIKDFYEDNHGMVIFRKRLAPLAA